MALSVQDLNRFVEVYERDHCGEPYVERAFPAAEYAERQRRFRAAMAEADVAIAVISAPDTQAWLHGYRSRWYRQHTSTRMPPGQCTVVATGTEDVFVIDSGYHADLVRSSSMVTDVRALPNDIYSEEDLDGYVAFLLTQLATVSGGGTTVGMELWSCLPSPAVVRRMEAALEAAGHRVVDVTLPVRGLRHVKSAAEVAMLERAQAACDAGLEAIAAQVRAGMTELEAWAIYMSAVVAAGGEPAALHETVAAGPTMPNLHRLSSRRPLRAGEVFHADAACSYLGYHARATRPYVIGSAPEELHALTALAAGAYDVLREVGKVGTPWQHLVDALRDYYAATGVEGGAAGYEMGITVPPADWVNEFVYSVADRDLEGIIRAGAVTNFESWNILALVDLVVFEESGPRVLSRVPQTLHVIGG